MELRLDIPENINIQDLFGNYDSNVKTVEKITETEMTVRDGTLIIKGKEEKNPSLSLFGRNPDAQGATQRSD